MFDPHGISIPSKIQYAQTDDLDNLENEPHHSAFGRAVATTISIPAVDYFNELTHFYQNKAVRAIQAIWGTFDKEGRGKFGEDFYRKLLSEHPQLLDYFAKTDMDALAVHQSMALDLIIKNVKVLGKSNGSFRFAMDHLGDIHRRMGVPTYSFTLVGGALLEMFQPCFDAHEQETKGTDDEVLAEDMTAVFAKIYTEIMSIVYYPMLRQEKLIAEAQAYYQSMKEEFEWSENTFQKRIIQVEDEITSTGTYVQTTAELEMGARLAWRNSAKCIGRISWNTLKIRDCRHINDPKGIFDECRKHLLEATAGTNIQSIMTVFKAQDPNQPFGTRFWSSQLVRYAGYKNPLGGPIIGDPANVELTEYLINEKLWTPPDYPSKFDVLPLVLKVPGVTKPYVHEVPSDCLFEVDLEHPTNPELSALGYRWATVPAITNFKMNLGGIVYQNMPFNGWFMSTEIVRNLMERYDAGPQIAKVLGLNVTSDPSYLDMASCELQRMVMHSFQKNGYTIVDPMSVGNSFCTHVKREREQYGRECPGQWSWIGGLVGPNNPTWHLEMRDFLLKPQYEYCAEGMLLHNAPNIGTADNDCDMVSMHDSIADLEHDNFSIPRILILYGSETGKAEAVARRLKKELSLLKPTVMSLNEAKGLKIVRKKRISHVLAVCSTFGKGQAPSNATEFFKSEISIKKHEDVEYAVLALGSSLYPDFCQAGMKLDKMLASVGFQSTAHLVKADEAEGAASAINSWIQTIRNTILSPSLESYLTEMRGGINAKPPVHSLVFLTEKEIEDVDTPKMRQSSLCIGNTELLKDSGSKSIRKITFETPAPYESGDHLSVYPVNSSKMVERFLLCFEFELRASFPGPQSNDAIALVESVAEHPIDIIMTVDGDDSEPADVFFELPAKLSFILRHKVDLSIREKEVPMLINLVKKFIDKKMEGLSSNMQEEIILKSSKLSSLLSIIDNFVKHSKDATSEVDSFIARFPTIVNFLETFQEVLLKNFFDDSPTLCLAELLVTLNRLQPRFYSISSSGKVNKNEVSISVGVLNIDTSAGVTINGVCSNYLAQLKCGMDQAIISVVQSSFRLPEDPMAPIIMVGAGTGLAPMMGFLEDKKLAKLSGVELGESHLFFGCRTRNDFIYEEDIRKAEQDGILICHLALSRSPETPKTYVQDKITDMGPNMLRLLLDKKTHYYVCGDARMANSCYESCLDLLRTQGNMSRVTAASHIKRMRVEGRWQSDVWGILSDFERAKKDVMKSKKMAGKLWLTRFNQND